MSITPSNLEKALKADLELRKSLQATGAFSSEVLLDLVFWNVVIAFVVNVSASVVYDLVRSRLTKDGALNGQEIAKLRALMNEPIDGYDPTRIEDATQAAVRVLEDHNVPAAAAVVRRAIVAATDDNSSSEG